MLTRAQDYGILIARAGKLPTYDCLILSWSNYAKYFECCASMCRTDYPVKPFPFVFVDIIGKVYCCFQPVVLPQSSMRRVRSLAVAL
eukprot:scaffold15212_cov116-Skeletonema_dohrnii-CCMP3373.AAC.1